MKPRARARILNRREAVRAVQRARRRGERVVFSSGCFDLLHIGHIRSLEQARSFGDLLIVGLNGDAVVRQLKGPGRPIVPARARAETLAALESVDFVLIFNGATPRATLAALQPDVYAKGGDWPLATLLAKDVPRALRERIEVRRLRQIPNLRSSELVARIRRGAR